MKFLNRAINILLVEDSRTDVILMKKMLSMLNTPSQVEVADDGVEAIAFLRKENKYQTKTRPDLIILDLNLPRKSGHEVLVEIKNDLILRVIPIIILSTSDSEKDILRCYENYANCYITKPMSLKDFQQQIKIIEDFWFNVAHYPSE
ncbi:MAG: response regulator [Cyanobacterium sp. T60_A2020_053]|nr:response regulator [Cyanobacterium sp. T60_A2020_053]